jgi:hypothetical protein
MYHKSASAKYWRALSVLFGAAALAIWAYVTFWISTPEAAFGERWVSVEIVLFSLPSGLIPGVPVSIPIQFKPVTGFAALFFLWFAAGVQDLGRQLNLTSPSRKQAIGIGAFLACMLTGYELMWSFSLWSARLAFLGSNSARSFNEIIDTVAFQSSYYPVNLVFSTKLFAAALFMGFYTLYYLHRLESKEAPKREQGNSSAPQ